MSPDTNDDGRESTVSIDEVSTQLRSYGRWLEERSDVELSAADLAFLDEIERNGFRSRPRVLAGVAAAVALAVVVVAGLGIGSRSGGEQLEAGPAGQGGVSTAEPSGDTPTSDTGSADRPAVGTDGDRSQGGEVPTADDLAAGIADATPDAEAPDGGPTAADAADEDEAADPVATDDPASEGAPTNGEAPTDTGSTPPTVEVDENDNSPWNPPATGSSGFVTPTNGAVLDLNAMNTLRARPVAGATAYVFEGWQNGAAVMSTSADEPTLVIPSRLITTGVMGQVEPGLLRLTVTAKDAAGNVLSSGEIEVTVAGSASSAAQDFVDDNPFTRN